MTADPTPGNIRLTTADWHFDRFDAVLAVLQAAFALQPRETDPPSSAHAETVESLAAHAAKGGLVIAERDDRPVGCVFFREEPDSLYLHKLAVDPVVRDQGLARRLVDAVAAEAVRRGHGRLTLSTRKALPENVALFERLGFRKTGEGTHPGYSAPTFWKMARQLAPE